MNFRKVFLVMGAIGAGAFMLGAINDAIEARENKKGRGR